MSNPDAQQTEEVKVDFEEEAPKVEEDVSLEQLNKECESIDAEQAKNLDMVKQLAAEVEVCEGSGLRCNSPGVDGVLLDLWRNFPY